MSEQKKEQIESYVEETKQKIEDYVYDAITNSFDYKEIGVYDENGEPCTFIDYVNVVVVASQRMSRAIVESATTEIARYLKEQKN